MKQILIMIVVGILLNGCTTTSNYYNEQGHQIHWMEPNFPFGMVRGAFVVVQGPLEYFPATWDWLRTQEDDNLITHMFALGVMGPIRGTIACVPHVFLGGTDILTLGLLSDEIYSSGLVTPLIWEEEGFLQSSKIEKREDGNVETPKSERGANDNSR